MMLHKRLVLLRLEILIDLRFGFFPINNIVSLAAPAPNADPNAGGLKQLVSGDTTVAGENVKVRHIA